MCTVGHSQGLLQVVTSRKLLTTAIMAVSLSAQADSKVVTNLDTMLVTATLKEQKQLDAPAATTIITRADIKQTSAKDLAELLRETTGVTLYGRGVGNRRVINLRGMESHHTLILVDGRRISGSDAVVGHSDFQNSWAPIEAIERIEVVRGALSSLYGSDSMGGVINIITRKPGKDWSGSLSLTAGVLSDDDRGGDERDLSFTFGGAVNENLTLRFDGELTDHDKTQSETDPDQTAIEGKESSSLGGVVNYQLNDKHSLEFQHRYIDEDRPRDTQSRRRPRVQYESTYELEKLMSSLHYKGEVMGSDLSAKIYRSSIDAVNSATNGVTPFTPQKLIDTIFETHLTRNITADQVLTLGAEIREEKLEHPRMANGSDSINNKALFIQDEIAFGENTFLTLGARFDDHELFGNEASPRAYLVHQLSDNWVVKGGYGEGFRSPTLKQISPNYRFDGPHSFVGNPDVGPETSQTYELAVQYQSDTLNGGVTLFRNDVNDLIQTSCIANCASRFGRVFEYVNVSESQIDGVEMNMNADLGNNLDLSMNLTYLDAENITDKTELTYRPDLSMNVRLSWTTQDNSLRVALRGQHIGQQFDGTDNLPSYNLWHLNLSKKFNEHLTLRAGIDNISDVDLSKKASGFSYQERGRFGYLGLDVAF